MWEAAEAEFQRCPELAQDAAEREEEQALQAAPLGARLENAVTTNENRPGLCPGCLRERARDAADEEEAPWAALQGEPRELTMSVGKER